LQLSHPHLPASSKTPKPHEHKSFELSKKILGGLFVFEGGVGDDNGDGVSRFFRVGEEDKDKVCEGVHGEDWEWEAEGDGRQVQGGEEVERERKY
jgi:hypothetical protein